MLHAGGPPSFTLRSAPAEVRFARCLMEVRNAEGQQRPPRAVCGASGGTERFPNEGGVVLEGCSGDSFGPVGHLGATDELGFGVTENGVHVHDLQATLMHLLGFDHERLTYRHQGRDFRLTDVHGKVVKDLLS